MLALSVSPAAQAASFAVNSTTDAEDATPGDGVCQTAGAVCTIRAAIQEANALGGADSITLPAGSLVLTVGGSDEVTVVGDLDITSDITITGAGAASSTIDGNDIDRVFDVHTGIVSMSDLTIQGGKTVNKGGGIRNFSDLTLTDCVISGNTASEGGGIHMETLGARLTLDNVTLLVNSADKGGGIRLATDGGLATLTDVTFDRNVATGQGGGMAVEEADADLFRVTFTDNDADIGGGLWTKDAASDVTLTNVTISGNDSTDEAGGIWAEGNSLTLTNVTVANNTAFVKGGGIRPKSGAVTLKNTIFANNTPDNCERAVTSAGNNVDSGTTCALPPAESNIDPLLGTLQNNGGPTFTHALSASSPAIDAGTNSGCPATDQRGVGRPLDGDGDMTATCDIGAYEAPAVVSISGVVFEDVNYGGGAGRDLATASADAPSFAVGRPGATVELYDAAGSFLSSTTTAAGGAYSFVVPSGSYTVRVVAETVGSSRPGADGSELGTQTYRADGASEAPGHGARKVGGERPSNEDAAANSGAQALAALQGTDLDADGVSEWTQSIVDVNVTGHVSNVDFGFNFSVVVNTNDSGHGSLRQFILNSNRLN